MGMRERESAEDESGERLPTLFSLLASRAVRYTIDEEIRGCVGLRTSLSLFLLRLNNSLAANGRINNDSLRAICKAADSCAIGIDFTGFRHPPQQLAF